MRRSLDLSTRCGMTVRSLGATPVAGHGGEMCGIDMACEGCWGAYWERQRARSFRDGAWAHSVMRTQSTIRGKERKRIWDNDEIGRRGQ